MIAALLSWYDEPPAQLSELVASLTKIPIDHLIALDGAYALFPEAKARSRVYQHTTLIEACGGHGIPLTLHVPSEPWAGNEIEKRTALFHLAESATTERDWYFVVDGDERVVEANNVKAKLADTTFDVGEALVHDPDPLDDYRQRYIQLPMFFRAIRGLRCHLNHFTYRTPDGRNLWGNARTMRLEPRVQLDMLVDHRPRPEARRLRANRYYQDRDRARAEDAGWTRAAA